MDTRHPSHRYLSLPDWAFDKTACPSLEGLDLRLSSLHAVASMDSWERVPSVPCGAPLPVGLHELRRDLASAYRVPTDFTYAAPGIGYAFRLICQSLLRPGDKVAISEPVPDWVKRCVLATGALYVDIGRDWAMKPQQGALKRLLEDGDIRMCFVQTVCSLTGTLNMPNALPDTKNASDPIWIFDHTWQPSPATDVQGLHLIDVSQRRAVPGHPLCLASGEKSLIEGLWRLDPKPSLSAQAARLGQLVRTDPKEFLKQSEAWLQCRENLRVAIQNIPGIRVTGSAGPAVMIAHPEKSGLELFEDLRNLRIHVDASTSHTFHEHVALRLPMATELGTLTQALRSLYA